jgi:hypothetical protein
MSAYLPLAAPTRLADTRLSGAIGQGGTINVKVTDGVLAPAVGTTAVVLNLTVVGPSGVGFWTAFAHGAPRPLAASLYVDERASMLGGSLAMPNLVTVPVGADGTVDIFSQSGGHVVVDMLGRTSRADPSRPAASRRCLHRSGSSTRARSSRCSPRRRSRSPHRTPAARRPRSSP